MGANKVEAIEFPANLCNASTVDWWHYEIPDCALGMGDNLDYWTDGPIAPSATADPVIQINTIKDIVPLDDRFGIEFPKTAPEMLYEPLFGQPDSTEDELAGVGVPLVHTYAVLDAARVDGLPELPESSGLPHACLFDGATGEELREVAPWLVKLAADSAFTRCLLSRGDKAWHLWDRRPGFYLRSTASLQEIRGHLRRYVRLADASGAWRYFRFWEGGMCRKLLQRPAPATCRTHLFCDLGK